MVADERTNSILLSGDKLSRFAAADPDRSPGYPVDSGGNTQVVYLRYAKAGDLVTVLQGVSKNVSNEPRVTRRCRVGKPRRRAVAVAEAAACGGYSGRRTTNALVITAPPEVIRSIRSVIAQLDVRRARCWWRRSSPDLRRESRRTGRAMGDRRQFEWIGWFHEFRCWHASLANLIGLAARGRQR